MPTTEQKDQSSDASEIREKLLEIGKKLSDGEDAMLELKTLLEENNLGINADSNLLTVTWVLDQLIYGLDIHFGEGLSVREECKPSLETYARQLNQSIGDYIADALGSNPSIVAMANMIDALFQLYNFAASAIEPAHP